MVLVFGAVVWPCLVNDSTLADMEREIALTIPQNVAQMAQSPFPQVSYLKPLAHNTEGMTFPQFPDAYSFLFLSL